MKRKTLLFSLVVLASFIFKLSAQEVLVSENFSSAAWEAELIRLNPGTSVNPNALNPAAYAAFTATGSYTNLNPGLAADGSEDLYFGKYRLGGAIEVKTVLPCAQDGISHDNNGFSIGFRLQNTAAGLIEFPELPSVGNFTIHIRNGNSTNATQIAIEKFVVDTWVQVQLVDIQPNSAYDDGSENSKRDEIITFNLDLVGPVKLRLVNNVATNKKFMNLYMVKIESKAQSALEDLSSTPFKIAGRKIMTETPTVISVFNTTGVKVFEKNVEREIVLPAEISKGIYVVKGGLGVQKIMLN